MVGFLKVVLGTLTGSLLIWYFVFLHSQTKVHSPREVPFFTETFEIIAHRGGAIEAPENTLLSFEHASGLGEDIVLEMDVQFTADKKVVVFHDETLDRVTNGTGPIWRKNLEELKKLDAAYNYKTVSETFPLRGTGVQIPTLQEVLQKFNKNRIVIELKQRYPELAFAVYEIIKDFNFIPQTIIGSEFNQPLKYLRRMDPRFYFTASQDEVLRTNTLITLQLQGLDPMKPDAYFIPIKHGKIPVLTDDLIQEVHKRGKKIYVWTINDVEVAKELRKRGVDGIVTDIPKEMMAVFKD